MHTCVASLFYFVFVLIVVFSNRIDCEDCNNVCNCEECVNDFDHQGKCAFIINVPVFYYASLEYFL